MLTEENCKAALSWATRIGLIDSVQDLVEGEDYEVIE